MLLENIGRLILKFSTYQRIQNIEGSSYVGTIDIALSILFLVIIVVLYKFPQPNVYFGKFRRTMLGLRLLMVMFTFILGPILDFFITASSGNPTASNPIILSLIAYHGVDFIVLLIHIPVLYYFGMAVQTYRELLQISADDALYRGVKK